MEKELFIIQNQLDEANRHLKAIRGWVALAGIMFIVIPLALVIFFMAGLSLIK